MYKAQWDIIGPTNIYSTYSMPGTQLEALRIRGEQTSPVSLAGSLRI